ncbi:MAG TPA: hypothetical protein VFE56_03430, partial [Candidatus Binataceae bacterium]|nr:hypothetical protein [Candidatus Binataceae bacterium]
MTTNNVVSDQHSAVIQNQTTGVVDFLRFNGSTLQSSVTHDYGLAGWTIVGNGDFNGDGLPDLVAQNQVTGQLDFLFLNAAGSLTSSALGPVVPHAVGVGFFEGPTFINPTGQVGPSVVTQLANGQLDILGFNGHGGLVASDLIANTVGLPTAVGVSESNTFWPVFANDGPVGNDNVLVQDAAGNLIAIGFTGGVGVAGGLTYSNSFARGPLTDSIVAGDQDNDVLHQRDANIFSTVDGVSRETFDAVGVNLATGQIDIHSWVSGYGDPSHEGNSLGTVHTNFTLSAGWQVVDAGIVD